MAHPEQMAMFASLGLGAASASDALSLGDHLGIRFSGNRSLSRLLFKVNPNDQHFSRFPSGTDLNMSFYPESPAAGNFKLSAYFNSEQVGVQAQQMLSPESWIPRATTACSASTSGRRRWMRGWRRSR